MVKRLSEMSNEELWQLFPIVLTKYNACWNEWYIAESSIIRTILPSADRISHIGSTAIDAIWAKPIVDILVEVSSKVDLLKVKRVLLNNGYLRMSQSTNRLSFNKGYTEYGFAEKVFHLHLRHTGDNDELYFRDYLIEHQEIAKEYEILKISLWKEYEHNRDAYTEAKTEFVKQFTNLAKSEYTDRYL